MLIHVSCRILDIQDTPSPIFPASRMAVLQLLAPPQNIARHLQILLSVGIASRHIRIRSSCTAGDGSSVLIHRGPENACDAQTQANGPSPKAPRQTARCPLSARVSMFTSIKARNCFLADSLGNRRLCSAEQAPRLWAFRIRALQPEALHPSGNIACRLEDEVKKRIRQCHGAYCQDPARDQGGDAEK